MIFVIETTLRGDLTIPLVVTQTALVIGVVGPVAFRSLKIICALPLMRKLSLMQLSRLGDGFRRMSVSKRAAKGL